MKRSELVNILNSYPDVDVCLVDSEAGGDAYEPITKHELIEDYENYIMIQMRELS